MLVYQCKTAYSQNKMLFSVVVVTEREGLHLEKYDLGFNLFHEI